MPDANGRFKGISVPRLPWRDPEGKDDTQFAIDCVKAQTHAADRGLPEREDEDGRDE